jgi:glycerol-3-phosphate dehydrogenase
VTHDLLVIGGGITGLAIARLAACNGFSTVLIERSDFASGTSSRSSHMLHGGLRYLEHGHFSLVRESLAERATVSRMAPALSEPRRFVVPLYRGDRLGPWRLRAGLTLYDVFASGDAFSRHSMVRRREVLALEPDLEREGLRGAGIYSDVVMDDARLAILVARDAAARGARLHSYTELLGARPGESGTLDIQARDVIDGTRLDVNARVVVNATGPWCDATRIQLARALRPGTPDPAPLLRPSRGAHLVFPALTRGHALLLTARHDGRVFFVLPFAGLSLVGTTEIETSSPPCEGAWQPTVDEVRYLRDELGRALPDAQRLPPLAVFAGLRPLLDSGAEVGGASREHRIVQEHGILSIAGGKYTTFRPMARDVVTRVAARLGRTGQRFVDPTEPLPAPLAPGADTDRIAAFAVTHEMARRVEDVVRRRSALWLEPDRGRAAAARIARTMGEALGWSASRVHEEFQSWDAALREEENLLERAAAS